MGCTLNGWGVMRGELLLSSRGVWTADVEPTDDAEIVKGQTATLVIGDLTLTGTILSGAMGVANSSFFVVGGAGGWRKKVQRRPYFDSLGVRLSDVVRDLATETGEKVALGSSLTSKVLGESWVRPEGTGTDALAYLGVPWRVLPSGTTFIGPLATTEAAGIVSLRRYMASIGRAIVDLPDSELTSVVPGSIVDFGELSMTVGTARVLVSSGSIWAELDP
ncbi:MAG: hypothetical protein U0441_14920 [Polyangiaceae bacterium]